MPRVSYVIIFLAGILLVAMPLGWLAFPWVQAERWAAAAAWWLAIILAIGFLEKGRHQ